MDSAGIIGIGDMGSGLAKNLMAAGHETWGFDLDAKRMAAFEAAGGKPAASVAAVGRNASRVFVMVMNGQQAKAVILGSDGGEGGLASTMAPGGTIILTATIMVPEAEAIAAGLEGTGIELVDSPVSGGGAGAQNGTLTMMAAASDAAFAACEGVMNAVGATIIKVGDRAGQGQAVKGCLQGIIGSIFAASYEAAVLAAKSGVSGETLRKVVGSTGAANGITDGSFQRIFSREFVATGSHISTMHKDLSITLEQARHAGVPMFTAAAAMQLFQCGLSKHPEGDNQIVTRVLEDIAGAEAHW